ncbi:MAG: DNA primase DnaG [Candidatus Bathyarchaeia archaeon]|jgi:DNA primase|nr:DNA primase [Candidatus Bathyarchaeota archaeon]
MQETGKFTPTTKYIIKAKFDVEGVVEKPDVIGAIFGQTEGLFGPDLDLRELQKSGRLGRIGIKLESKNDRTSGEITIPSSLDKTSTAIIAAAVESVDRIGPCNAKILLEPMHDERDQKREMIKLKAKQILQGWMVEATPSTDEVIQEISDSVRPAEISKFGSEELPAGPEVAITGSIIVVEGRADVINLLKCGIKNAIGINGTKIPKTIIELCKNKEITAFLDGDRGGDLILKELIQVAELDYVARAPPRKEVEDLTPKEIMRCLREKVQAGNQQTTVRPTAPPQPQFIVHAVNTLRETLEAIIFDGKGAEIKRIPVSELAEKLKGSKGAHAVVFDGIITQRLLDIAEEKKISIVVGDRVSNIAKKPVDLKILTFSDIR